MNFFRTPSDVINILGGGGLRPSTLVELWGENKSGKSTFAYQTSVLFQEDYPDGEILIVDSEMAGDKLRLQYVFGLDYGKLLNKETGEYEKVKKNKLMALEDCFVEIMDFLNLRKSKPSLVIWDTISASPTRNDLGSDGMFSGGISERSRVIKYYLMKLLVSMYNKNAVVLLPNQVYSKIGSYVGGYTSGGGEALKHDLHYSFEFKNVKDLFDETGNNAIMSLKSISIDKSRFIPKVNKIPLYIDIERGGSISVDKSTLLMVHELGLILGVKGWYWYKGEEDSKKVRWSALEKSPETFKRCHDLLKEYYMSKYFMVRKLNE